MPYVEAIASDAGDPKLAKALVDHVSKKYGRIDILYVNAGIARIAPLVAAMKCSLTSCFVSMFAARIF
jgi:NAD(P)-dependent dehydrogenase (short-subunit alcohol dehydrogenase family)